MTTEQKPMNEVLQGVNIRMKATRTDRNPHMDDSMDMDHWRCVIRCGSESMSLVFSKGSGHHGAEPTLEEVLDCLASDAAGYDNAQSFEDWAGELGYDTDSRKAERTYKAIAKQAESLKRVLSEELYKALLWDTERL
jgi:hypothetical protein